MRSAMYAEAALTVALLTLASVGFHALRRNWRATDGYLRTQASEDDFQQTESPLFPSLGGITAASDKPALLRLQRGVKRYVVFVVHSASLERDIAVWEGVEQRIGTGIGVALVGYCDRASCSRKLSASGVPPPFLIIGYTGYRTARVLANADAARRALVLNGDLVASGSLRWDDATSAVTIAAAIRRLM